MRILGFSKRWPKLNQNEFTTFRYPRRDRDWFVGEKVQIMFRPRSPNREWLGIAEIISIEKRNMSWKKMSGVMNLSYEEALKDGFGTRSEMIAWLYNLYGDRILREPMNLLRLHWIEEAANDQTLL